METTQPATASAKGRYPVKVQRIRKSRIHEIDFNNIPFGRVFSDHMLIADFRAGRWRDTRIVPYGKLPMSPSISALHYGQSIFEGIKAYLSASGEVLVFRPWENLVRINRSAERMCIPPLPEEIFIGGLKRLLRLDSAWVPTGDGNALYIRPLIFATTEQIKVKPSDTYRFVILTCPVGRYYPEPLRVKVEKQYTRAALGGVGFTKAAGNYGSALAPAKEAQDHGYHQLLWTDGREHKYIEESGTMNVMFVIRGTLITPSLESDTILPGVTRDSVLTLARERGISIEERRISVEEVLHAAGKGTLNEAFGTGTAATIAPIQLINCDGVDYSLPSTDNPDLISAQLYKEMQAIRRGRTEDRFGWMMKIK